VIRVDDFPYDFGVPLRCGIIIPIEQTTNARGRLLQWQRDRQEGKDADHLGKEHNYGPVT